MINKQYIIEHFSNLDPETILLSSGMTKEGTIMCLDGFYPMNYLDAITAIYPDDGEVEYDQKGDVSIKNSLKLKDLLLLISKMKDNPNIFLNRDIEDGYTFSSYKEWIYYKNYLVFI